MKAKIKPRIELENRTKLEKVIPLETPFLVFLDPADICNFQCKFCPTGNRALIKKIKRNSGLMDFDLYKEIVDKAGNFGIIEVRLFLAGEPLLHKKKERANCHFFRYSVTIFIAQYSPAIIGASVAPSTSKAGGATPSTKG